MVKAIILASGLAAVAAAAPQFFDDDFQAPSLAVAQAPPKAATAPKAVAPVVAAAPIPLGAIPIPVPVAVEVDGEDYDYGYEGEADSDDYDYKQKRQILGSAIDATTNVASDVVSGAASVIGDMLAIPGDLLGLGGDYGYGYDSKDDAEVVAIIAKRNPQLISDLLSAITSAGSDLLSGAYGAATDVGSNVASAAADLTGLSYKEKRQILGEVADIATDLVGDLTPFSLDGDYDYDYDYKNKRQILGSAIDATTNVASDVVSGAASVIGDLLAVPADLLGLGGDYGYGYGSDDKEEIDVAVVADALPRVPGAQPAVVLTPAKRQILSAVNDVASDIIGDLTGADYGYDYDYDYDYKNKRQILGDAIDATTGVAGDVVSGAASVIGDLLAVPADILGLGSDYGYGYGSDDKEEIDVAVVADALPRVPGAQPAVVLTPAKRQILSAVADTASDVVSGAANVIGDILGVGSDYGYGYDDSEDIDVAIVADALPLVPGAQPAVIISEDDKHKRQILGAVADIATDLVGDLTPFSLDGDYDYDYDYKNKRQILSAVADTASDVVSGAANVIGDILGVGSDYGYGYDDDSEDIEVALVADALPTVPGAQPAIIIAEDDKHKRQVIADVVEGTTSVAGDVVSGAASVIGDMLAIPANLLGLGDYGYGYDSKDKRQVIADVVEGTSSVAGDIVSGSASVLGDIAAAGADLLGLGDYGYDYKQKRQILSAVNDVASDILGDLTGADYDYDYDYDYKNKRQLLGGLLSDLVGDLTGANYDGPDVDEVIVVDAAPVVVAKRQLLGGLLSGVGDLVSDVTGSNRDDDTEVIVVDGEDRPSYCDFHRCGRFGWDYKRSNNKRQIVADLVDSSASVVGDLLAVPADILGLGSDYGYGDDSYDYKQKRQLAGLLSSLFNPFGLGATEVDDAPEVDVVEVEPVEVEAAPVADATYAPAAPATVY